MIHRWTFSAAVCAVFPALAVPVLAQEQVKAPQGFPDLVAGLKAEPGCLGVETAQTASGKNVIFAWFKDKAAVLHWYGSQMHQEVMNKFLPSPRRREPMSMVKDSSGPIMVTASITPSEKAKVGKMPISQIAIELYAPLPGGASIGGRFAPNSVKLANHIGAPGGK